MVIDADEDYVEGNEKLAGTHFATCLTHLANGAVKLEDVQCLYVDPKSDPRPGWSRPLVEMWVDDAYTKLLGVRGGIPKEKLTDVALDLLNNHGTKFTDLAQGERLRYFPEDRVTHPWIDLINKRSITAGQVYSMTSDMKESDPENEGLTAHSFAPCILQIARYRIPLEHITEAHTDDRALLKFAHEFSSKHTRKDKILIENNVREMLAQSDYAKLWGEYSDDCADIVIGLLRAEKLVAPDKSDTKACWSDNGDPLPPGKNPGDELAPVLEQMGLEHTIMPPSKPKGPVQQHPVEAGLVGRDYIECIRQIVTRKIPLDKIDRVYRNSKVDLSNMTAGQIRDHINLYSESLKKKWGKHFDDAIEVFIKLALAGKIYEVILEEGKPRTVANAYYWQLKEAPVKYKDLDTVLATIGARTQDAGATPAATDAKTQDTEAKLAATDSKTQDQPENVKPFLIGANFGKCIAQMAKGIVPKEAVLEVFCPGGPADIMKMIETEDYYFRRVVWKDCYDKAVALAKELAADNKLCKPRDLALNEGEWALQGDIIIPRHDRKSRGKELEPLLAAQGFPASDAAKRVKG